MAAERTRIDKGYLLGLLDEARELRTEYSKANKENPKDRFEFTAFDGRSVDDTAIRLFEEQEGVTIVGIRRSQDLDGGPKAMKVYAQVGRRSTNGLVDSRTSDTISYQLVNFNGTTVARFADSVARIVEKRQRSGEIKGFELPPSYARNVRVTAAQYAGYSR